MKDDEYGPFVPFHQSRPVSRSPLARASDLSIGGTTSFAAGTPGSGKSTLAYKLAHARYSRERLWVRGTLDDTWWHIWPDRSVVWCPEDYSVGFTVTEGGIPKGPSAVEIRPYRDSRDVLARAERGRVHVVYADVDAWLFLLRDMVDRDDRIPQLVLDDEVQEVCPSTNLGIGPEDFTHVSKFLGILRDSRKAYVSFLLASQQVFDTHYSLAGKVHYWYFLPGSRVPRTMNIDFKGKLRALTLGQGVCVGATQEGLRWEEFNFPPAPRRPQTLIPRKARTITSKLIPPREAAELAGVSVRTLQEWDRQGRLKGTVRTPTGRRRFLLSEVKELLASPRGGPNI